MIHTKNNCVAHNLIIAGACGLACANCGACKCGNCCLVCGSNNDLMVGLTEYRVCGKCVRTTHKDYTK